MNSKQQDSVSARAPLSEGLRKASKVNPEKPKVRPVYQRVYYRERGRLIGCTILCGKRYVDPQPVELQPLRVVMKNSLTTKSGRK